MLQKGMPMKKILIIAAAFAACALLEKPGDHNLNLSATLSLQDAQRAPYTPAAKKTAEHPFSAVDDKKSPLLQSL